MNLRVDLARGTLVAMTPGSPPGYPPGNSPPGYPPGGYPPPGYPPQGYPPGYPPAAPPGYPPQFGPPAGGDGRPPAVGYARIFAVAMSLLYVGCALFGAVSLLGSAAVDAAHSEQRIELMIKGVIMVVMGVPLAILCAYAFIRTEQRTKGMYTLHLVLQGLACTSCCCIPAALPLLLAWLKPGVKQWYGAS